MAIEREMGSVIVGKNFDPTILSRNQDELYEALWHACAGPLVAVPQVGEKVFYFPQGHLEQVAASTSNDGFLEIPINDIPSMILCTVVHIQLKVEVDIDEVFAQITLVPETKKEAGNLETVVKPPPVRTNVYSCKILTASDTSPHGGLSILKRHADEFLPPLDMSCQTPTQDLAAKDLHGTVWHFRHVYRGQPKRHLFTCGWSFFTKSKGLVTGDSFILLRGENEKIRVGFRRAHKSDYNVSASVMSGYSMQLGILASATHAISTNTMFTVYYRPRTSPSEFIISYDQYMESTKTPYSVGMRFRMKFEGEDSLEQRLAGTIVGTEDVDRVRWPGSRWRCLKVQWDDTSTSVVRPNRVSPWNIEQLAVTSLTHPIVPRTRRARAYCSSPESSSLAGNGLQGPIEPPPPKTRKHSQVLQGQEARKAQLSENSQRPSPPLWVPPPSYGRGQAEAGKHNSFYPSPGNALSFRRGSPPSLGLNGYSFPWFPSCWTGGNVGTSRNSSMAHFSPQRSGFHELRVHEPKQVTTPVTQPKASGTCMLFGVDLVKSSGAASPISMASDGLSHAYNVPPTSSSSGILQSFQLSDSKSAKPSDYCGYDSRRKPCKNCSITFRTYTKVHKYGTALGRSVDLTKFEGYDWLIRELDRMFEFGGKLMDRSNGWRVIYTDNEGNAMRMGDYSWGVFYSRVQKMFIFPEEEVNKLIPGSPNLMPL